MNNYKSFSKLKEELGDNYDFKLYEMGISALKEIENLQEKNKQLQERIEYLERSNNRREDTIFEQSQKISDLEDNWDILKNFIDTLWLDNKGIVTKIKNKIKFIEQGYGSNVED